MADEALELIEEIREFSPNAFIRRECSSLLSKLKSGFEIPVPLFCDTGDKIEIDTRTNEYRNRVKG